ncbi:MAG: hypothetical protein JW749_01950 [Sedimentisphaerales bacterium]|nr:hypothetical protein [Sedimentisphaerales bacterium]
MENNVFPKLIYEMTPLEIPNEKINEARKIFKQHEPRDVFYRAATVLVELALNGKIPLSPAESIAVLLQTWNKAYYQFRKFDARHYCDIESLLDKHLRPLKDYRNSTIDRLNGNDEYIIKDIFKDFEIVLGPVGAAKSLHLIAPSIFPLWDRAIAKEYKTSLKKIGTNADNYLKFMQVTKQQYTLLRKQDNADNLLKAIDEYNYCKYTKKWI